MNKVITFNDVAGVLNNYFHVEEISTEKYKRSIKWHVNENTYLLEEKRQWLLSKNDKIIEGITKIKDVYDYIIELKEMLFQIRDVSCENTNENVSEEKKEIKYEIKRYNQTTFWKTLNKVYNEKDNSDETIQLLKDLYEQYPEEFSNGYRCLCSKKRRDFIDSLLKEE